MEKGSKVAIYAKTGRSSVLYQVRNLIYKDAQVQIENFKKTLLGKGNDLFQFDYTFIQGESLEALGGSVPQITTYLCQLQQLGVFQQVKGILLGTFTKMEELKKAIHEIQIKDRYTEMHCIRVGVYAQRLAGYLDGYNISIKKLMFAANVHDIGKCQIPDDILLKPGRFTPEERQVMNQHSRFTYDILKDNFKMEEEVCNIALCHHERYDGTGYPNGLRGSEIPLEAQIIAIADTFDAMTTERPYQKARPSQEALKEMLRFQHEYHPEVFKVFKELVELEKIGPHIIPDDLIL